MLASDLQAEVDAVPYWYHRIELPGGIVTPGWAPLHPEAYGIPDDLTAKSVLDVGAWDGYWTWEALKRNAVWVTAIDDFSDTTGGDVNADRREKWRTFDLCRHALKDDVFGSVERFEFDIQDANWPSRYKFDIVFCFGVLYHVKRPMQVLYNLRDRIKPGGTIYIESAVLDFCTSPNGRAYSGDECVAEFFPGAEFGMNPSNWWVPTLRCLREMVIASEFRNVVSWRLTDQPKSLAECRGFIKGSV